MERDITKLATFNLKMEKIVLFFVMMRKSSFGLDQIRSFRVLKSKIVKML